MIQFLYAKVENSIPGLQKAIDRIKQVLAHLSLWNGIEKLIGNLGTDIRYMLIDRGPL